MSGVDELAVTPKEIANHLHRVKGVRCNCDLDNWSPTSITGHTSVCRIHKSAVAKPYDMAPGLIDEVRAARVTGGV
ncbi:hypothetical protein ACYX7E_10115 [Luteimonas sp. RIT-PG2_3]